MAWVYILRCSDGCLYVGHASNLEVRVTRHNKGVASKYTSRRLPVELLFAEQHDTHESAIARERQLKRWTTAKKEALIAGDLATLKSRSVRGRK